jgi:hypothetical protein
MIKWCVMPVLATMLVLLVLDKKYWHSKQAHLLTQPACLTWPTCLVSLPALFVPATSTFVLLKWIFYKLICLEQCIYH